ncbi:MAG: hypothetical protein ABIF01_01470 [Candidatus Micrarchaeota archaeon]
MFKDTSEMSFYALSGVAFSIGFYAFGLFRLNSYPMAVPLLLSAFALNLLLTHLGRSILGPDSHDLVLKAVFASAVGAFFFSWLGNLGGEILTSIALPVSIMFLLPSVLYYVRQMVMRDEIVQAG